MFKARDYVNLNEYLYPGRRENVAIFIDLMSLAIVFKFPCFGWSGNGNWLICGLVWTNL